MKDKTPNIHPTAYVEDSVRLGDWSTVHAGAMIYGDVTIGRAAWINEGAIIGGGQKERGSLKAGDFLHLGVRSFVNIADKVSIGDEVGLGMETKIFTHGGYLSELEGFPYQRGPVSIGDNVWLPYAIVLPDVWIRDNVVVAAMSLVHRDLPSGCLAGGVPTKIIQHNAYPETQESRPFFESIIKDAKYYGVRELGFSDNFLSVGSTIFYVWSREIAGAANKDTEIVKDLLRRRGVRFRYYDNKGEYQEWD